MVEFIVGVVVGVVFVPVWTRVWAFVRNLPYVKAFVDSFKGLFH